MFLTTALFTTYNNLIFVNIAFILVLLLLLKVIWSCSFDIILLLVIHWRKPQEHVHSEKKCFVIVSTK